MVYEGYPSWLAHYGIPGMKWGVRRYQNYDGSLTSEGRTRYGKTAKGDVLFVSREFKSVRQLSNHMKHFKYKEFDKLMSAEDVERTRSGSCHDQCMYESQKLRAMGKEPKGIFFIENDGKGQGGTTHSLVYYKENGKIVWFENSWGGMEGLHTFNNKRELVNFIKKQPRSMPHIDFGVFNDLDHTPGEDLQEFVDICMEAS